MKLFVYRLITGSPASTRRKTFCQNCGNWSWIVGGKVNFLKSLIHIYSDYLTETGNGNNKMLNELLLFCFFYKFLVITVFMKYKAVSNED